MYKKKMSPTMKFLRAAVCILLVLLLLFTTVAPLFADELEEMEEEKEYLESQLSETQNEQSYTAEQLAAIRIDIEAILSDIAALDQELVTCQNAIMASEQSIQANQDLISENRSRLAEVRQQESEHYEELKSRLKMMYEYGDVNYLEVLFGAKSISDFFSRIEYVGRMAEYDKEIQDNIRSDREEIQQLEASLSQTELELEMNQANLASQKAHLDELMAEKQGVYSQLRSNQEYTAQYLVYLQEKQDGIAQLIQDKQEEIQIEKERLAEEARRAAEEAARKAAEEAARAAEEAARAAREAEEAARQRQAQAEEEARRERERQQQQSAYTETGGTFVWPVPSSYYVASPYGYRIHPVYGSYLLHAGTDIGALTGANIVAADAGYVLTTGYDEGGYGYYVILVHSSGYMTLYGHCSSLLVYGGQTVARGQVIALVGSTGLSTGPHCHFEVMLSNGSTVDPMSFF